MIHSAPDIKNKQKKLNSFVPSFFLCLVGYTDTGCSALVSAGFLCLFKGDTKGRGITGPVNRNGIYNYIKLTHNGCCRCCYPMVKSGGDSTGCVYAGLDVNVKMLLFYGCGGWVCVYMCVCVCGGGGGSYLLVLERFP